MFDVFCPTHGARVLIFPTSVDAVENTDQGILVHYHCTCGTKGVWRTGRAA
ncbi:MAG TPA: hypothetical protein VGC11_11325 [Acidimicrobiia bacterium]|jgi:hypothetical protein